MNKLLKIFSISILLALLLSSCSNQSNLERLIAIYKINNDQTGRWLKVHFKEDNKWKGLQFKIEPTINSDGQPDVNLSVVDNKDQLDVNLEALKFIRIEDRPSKITTNDQVTTLVYYYLYKGCEHNITMHIKAPVKSPKKAIPNKSLEYEMVKHFTYKVNHASDLTCNTHKEYHSNPALGIKNHQSSQGGGRD